MNYVTKYSATKGILEVEDHMLDVRFNIGRDYFTDLDKARMDAIKRTRKKVTALFKKEQALEAKISQWESELPV